MLIEYQLNLPQYAQGALSSAGDSASALVGAALATGSLADTGTSSTSLIGAALDAGAMSAAGDSGTSIVGAALSIGELDGTGDSSSALIGSTSGNVMTGAGDSTATVIGASIAEATMFAAGDSSADLDSNGPPPETAGGGFGPAHRPTRWTPYHHVEAPVPATIAVASFAIHGDSSSSLRGSAIAAGQVAGAGAGVASAELAATATSAGAFTVAADSAIAWGGVSIFEGSFRMAAKGTSNLTGETLYDHDEIEQRVRARLAEMKIGLQIRVRRPVRARRPASTS